MVVIEDISSGKPAVISHSSGKYVGADPAKLKAEAAELKAKAARMRGDLGSTTSAERERRKPLTPVSLAIAFAVHGFAVLSLSTMAAVCEVFQGGSQSPWPWLSHGTIVLVFAMGCSAVVMGKERTHVRYGSGMAGVLHLALLYLYGKHFAEALVLGKHSAYLALYFTLLTLTASAILANCVLLPKIKYRGA
eukprot:TRINITY_DN39395_c0_g1_i1.p1 TRINITY_DN39395_c0_g1~~TRINITY_DN39395_c0_g1_i1.p1  ORF type:complete len:192 (+),score=22.58 TRINITY_DN39395_c0_g1_i1:163-738(+)